jgi:outer membrane biosynthesis protein TonB
MRNILFLIITVLLFSSALAQTTNVQTNEANTLNDESKMDCSFSTYNPLKISHFLTAAVRKVEPKYSLAARSVKASGKVTVQILVNRKGDVVKACVLEGHPLLRSSSIQAAENWKFKKDFGFSAKFKPKKRYVEAQLTFNFESPK